MPKAKKPKKAFIDYTPEEIIKYREQFAKNILRRSTYRWPWKNIALRLSKVGRNQYKCANCGEIVPNKRKKVDHINPVVDPAKGFQGWDMFIKRLFIGLSGLQVLCMECHNEKTKAEREIRKITRANAKANNNVGE